MRRNSGHEGKQEELDACSGNSLVSHGPLPCQLGPVPRVQLSWLVFGSVLAPSSHCIGQTVQSNGGGNCDPGTGENMGSKTLWGHSCLDGGMGRWLPATQGGL